MGDYSPPEHLHSYYYDFAYENKGPFRMANGRISDTSAKSFAELLSGPLMDIYVGQEKRHWSLHHYLLCYHSDYFKNRFDGDSKKKLGKVELLDDDPKAFEVLIKWLYQGTIDDVNDMPMEKKWDYAETCQKLYVLCDRINLPGLKNQAIDQFRRGCFDAGLVPGPEEMKPIYDHTPPSSPFRKLVSKIAARQIMDPESESDAAKYKICFEASPDFAIDVVNAIREGAGGMLFADPTEGDGCLFHEHANGQHCNRYEYAWAWEELVGLSHDRIQRQFDGKDTTPKFFLAPLMEMDHRAKPAMVDGLKKFDNSRVGIAVWI